MAAEVFKTTARHQVTIADIAPRRERFEPLGMQHDDHAFFEPIIVVGCNVEAVLRTGHADGMSEIGIMRTMCCGVDMHQLAALRLPVGIGYILAPDEAWAAVRHRSPVVRHR